MDTQLSKFEIKGAPSKPTKKMHRREFIKIGIVAASLVMIRAYHYNLREEKPTGDSKVVKREMPDQNRVHEKPTKLDDAPLVPQKRSSLDLKDINESQDKDRSDTLRVTELF